MKLKYPHILHYTLRRSIMYVCTSIDLLEKMKFIGNREVVLYKFNP